jgi:Cu-Zn family superoxide dismutase
MYPIFSINTVSAAIGALALAGTPAFAQHMAMHQPSSETAKTQVAVMTADGQEAGTVTFEQTRHGVTITARLRNLSEGPHGFHIHETGACEPDFQAAGGHYNPLDAAHGFDSEGGYHVGDLPNIYVQADGTATADFFAPQLALAAKEDNSYPFTLQDHDGSAIMIHAKIDDYGQTPSGSTGDRVACGVIFPKN